MIVESLTSVLEVVPGEPIIGRVRIVNDSVRDANYQVRVVGIDLPSDWRPIGGGAVAAGAEVHVDVPILIPDDIGLGHHPVGIEVVSDQASERPTLTSMTVSVESVAGVLLRAEPSVVRGRATGKFRLAIENREPNSVELELVGGGADISARFKPARVVLQPGQRAISQGKLTGKRRWSGDEEQHFVTLTARGRASSQSITTRFVQRSMVPWRFRTLVAAVIVLSLWLAGALVYVWYQNSKTDTAADQASSGQTSDTDQPGDGSGDGAGDGSGTDGGGAGGSDGQDQADRVKVPTETTFGGAVVLADGSDPSDVTVSLDEIPLGQAGEGVAPKGFAAGPNPVKIWPARYGSGDRPGISSLRQTDTIRSVDTSKDGTWRIVSVALRRNYEVVFSRAGYDTQSFVVTPPEDGSPVALDVELQPAVGAIAGVVRSASGPLGGVTLVATDGDLVFSTTSSTDAGTLGEFSFNGLSTPGVYTVTVTRAGFGTEVVQFDLGAGQQRAGESISMRAGVGTIIGSVLARQPDVSGGTAEQLFGGVTITVSNGDLERTVTTLTEGAVGTFAVPGLPIPGTYTVSASAPEYGEASLTVTLDGDQATAQLRLISQFAALRGLVVDAEGIPISGAGVTLTTDELTFTSNTVSDAGDADTRLSGQFLVNGGTARLREATSFGSAPGEFQIGDLPPGEYRVEIVHFAHKSYSVTVQLQAGEDTFLPIEMTVREPYVGPTGSLTASAIDLRTESELGADEQVSFWLRRPGEPFNKTSPPVKPLAGEKKVSFAALPLGSYILRSSAPDYFPNEILVNVGEDQTTQAEVKLRAYGSVVVHVYDPLAPDVPLEDYEVAVQEVRTDGLNSQVIYGEVGTDGEGGAAWTTEQTDQLRDGVWEIVVLDSPPGYLIEPQGLSIGGAAVDLNIPEMRFQISSTSPSVIKVDLLASRFPTVKVRTYQPDVSDLANVSPLVDPLIAVRLECDDGLPIAAVALPTGGGAGLTGVYELSNLVLSEHPAVLTADSCQIVASGGSYGSSVVVLADKLQVTRDQVPLDPQLSVVMLPPPVTITGRVAWFDGIESVFVPDATIVSSGLVVTGYPPTQAVGVSPDPPVAVWASVKADWDTVTTNPGGATPELSSFTFAGQAYGTNTYTVTSPNITAGSFKLSVVTPPNAVPLNSPASLTTGPTTEAPVIVPKSHDAATNSFAYDLTLTDPEKGVLQGCLTVKTVRPTPRFLELIEGITASSAFGDSVVVSPDDRSDDVAGCPKDDSATGGESVTQQQGFDLGRVAAGVWSVDYVLPAGDWYQFVPLAVTDYDITANVATVTTAAAHNLTVGSTVRIVGSTGTGDPSMDGDFVVASAPTATTYTFEITHGDVVSATASSSTLVTEPRRINPNATLNGFDRTVVENGTINLTIVPGDAVAPLGQPALATTYTVTPYTGAALGPVGIGSATQSEIRGVPVDAANPFVPVGGSLALAIPGYDVLGAQVTITSPVPASSTGDVGANDIPFSVQAGQDVNVRVDADPLGEITGSIKGYTWRDEKTAALGFSSLFDDIEVQYRVVTYTPSVPATLPPTYVRATSGGWNSLPPSALVADPDNNEIDFTLGLVAPGSYEFRVSPITPSAYLLDPPLSGTSFDVVLPEPPPDGAVLTDGTVYEMRNKERIAIPEPFALELAPATLELHLWESYDVGAGQGSALSSPGTSMRVFRVAGGQQIGLDGAPVSSGDPVWSLADLTRRDIQLQPDTYRLEIVNRDVGGDDVSFPATFLVTLPSGPTVASRTLRVDAVMPPLDRKLEVKVKVVNESWVAGDLEDSASINRLPVPTGVRLIRNWAALDSYVAGTATPNSANLPLPATLPETLQTCLLADAGSPGCPTVNNWTEYEQTLLFDAIPSGDHTVEVVLPDGYRFYAPTGDQVFNGSESVCDVVNASEPGPATTVSLAIGVDTDCPLTSTAITSWDLVLVVDDVQVDVSITEADDDDFPGQTAELWYDGVKLVEAGAPAGGITVVRAVASPTSIVITGLPPRRANYELRLDDELHAPNWDDGVTPAPRSAAVAFLAAVDTDDNPATYQQLTTTVVGDVARLQARLRLENVPNACGPPPFGVAFVNCPALPADGVFKIGGQQLLLAGGTYGTPFVGTTGPRTNGDQTIDVDDAGPHAIEVSNGIEYTAYAQQVNTPLGQISDLDVKLQKLARIDITVDGVDDDTGVVVSVKNVSSGNPLTQRPAVANTDYFVGPHAGLVWTYYVSVDVPSITFTVAKTGLFPVDVAETNLNIGDTRTPTATLASRAITVKVTNKGSATITPTVEVRIPHTLAGVCADVSYCEDISSQSVSAGSSPTSFVFPISDPMPLVGQAKVTVSATGYRTNTTQTFDDIVPNAEIPIDIRPLVAVSGSLSATSIPTGATTVVSATQPGGPTYPATVLANGTYTFTDNFDVGTWSVKASVIGWGDGSSAQFTIGATTVNEVETNSFTVPVITLAPRQIKATLTVQRPGGAAVLGWRYAVPPSTSAVAPGLGGVVTLTESGTLNPKIQIRETTSLWTEFKLDLGVGTVFGTFPGTQVDVANTLTLYAAPILKGLIIDTAADPDKAGNSNKVYLIADCTDSVNGMPKADDNGGGLFSFAATDFDRADLAFDSNSGASYCIYADGGGGKSAKLPITISSSGVVTTGSLVDAGVRIVLGTLGVPPMTVETSSASFATSGDLDGSGDFSVGDTLTWTVTVTNNSTTIPLTKVEAKSNNPAGGNLKNTCDVLGPGLSCELEVTYTVEPADVTTGSITINGSGKSEQNAEVDAAAVVTPITQPAVSVAGPVLPPSASVAGNVVFTYLVTNTGTGALTGLALVATNVQAAPTCSGLTGGKLPRGDTATCTATHAVTQAELNGGADLTSRVTVTTTQKAFPQTSPLTMYSITQNKSVGLVASVDSTSVAGPGPLTYTITITNTGNVDLNSVSLSKTRGTVPVKQSGGDTTGPGVFNPGETWTYTSTYPVTQADINSGSSLVNTFGVNATPSVSVTGTLSATTTITQTPKVTVDEASVAPSSISASVLLTYTVKIKNNGNVDLTGVSLTATYGTPIKTAGDTSNSGVLDLGETWTYSWTYTPSSGTAGTPVVNTFGFAATPTPTVTGTLSASTSVTATFS